ncbi:hypothetical protein [Actinomadura bangladeshensis]|uniref:Uncharacterized protein n=1 Tax=Actinomadura bangladeshensis TaxID=453573 RepID=A0A4R4NDG9_9ACTN|nr:hypothetical protein [Actinomadura bangladeshensis]TDC07198.1 hypothetical protein E1284_32740 [Actinomadura bangladeshensis]
MDPALAGLAGAVAAALVDAMTTDFWGTARTRLARIVGRGAQTAESDLTRELEESAGRVGRTSPPDQAAMGAEQARWTALLTAFLAEHMDASAELQGFVRHVREALPDADTVHIVQNITTGRDAFIAGRDQHISLSLDDDG